MNRLINDRTSRPGTKSDPLLSRLLAPAPGKTMLPSFPASTSATAKPTRVVPAPFWPFIQRTR